MKKGTIKIKPMSYPEIPPYRTRSEREMQELLHKWKVIKRRREVCEIISNNPSLITGEIIMERIRQGEDYLRNKLKI